MKPTEAWQELADIITNVTKRPYRDEPVTNEEWDSISERVLLLAKEQKGPSANQEEKK